MLTLPSEAIAVTDVRPAYRPYRARVAGIRLLSPHFTRVTFTGDDFGTFGTAGFDQRMWVDCSRELMSPVVLSEIQPLVDGDVLWDSPQSPDGGDFYAWLAGEVGVIKGLRRFLVSETGLDRSRVAFMGYWRQGRAAAQ